MKSAIEVYTVQMAQWRKVPKTVSFYDITVKSGNAAFAPQAKYLWALKANEMTEEEYDRLYCEDMVQRIVSNPEHYRKLLLERVEGKEALAFACYCRAGKFCHRLLLIEKVLPKVKDLLGLTFNYNGELT